MTFEFYAYLEEAGIQPMSGESWDVSSGFIDACTRLSASGSQNEARRDYLSNASKIRTRLPDCIELDSVLPLLPGWVGIDVEFTLETPWYAKDDRPFHVLDNPVRKDRVFGVPYVPASTWKGTLRWACRMQAGLYDHLEKGGMKAVGWVDPPWIVHLFGNMKGEQESLSQGALVFYPTWFSKIGFEVINPHSRKTRAGTQPIYYEIVPSGTEGELRLLYAPLSRRGLAGEVTPTTEDALRKLSDAIDTLLTTYGFSAKRTVGWGKACIKRWRGVMARQPEVQVTSVGKFKTMLPSLLGTTSGREGTA